MRREQEGRARSAVQGEGRVPARFGGRKSRHALVLPRQVDGFRRYFFSHVGAVIPGVALGMTRFARGLTVKECVGRRLQVAAELLEHVNHVILSLSRDRDERVNVSLRHFVFFPLSHRDSMWDLSPTQTRQAVFSTPQYSVRATGGPSHDYGDAPKSERMRCSFNSRCQRVRLLHGGVRQNATQPGNRPAFCSSVQKNGK